MNLHLLVSPEDPNHVDEIRRILTRLRFTAHNDSFDCTRQELIRLGKLADPSITNDHAALTHGATQVKVNFNQLRKVFSESDWAKKNILIAVAGGADDGTSGLRQAADAKIRQEIESLLTSFSRAVRPNVNSGLVCAPRASTSCGDDTTVANRVCTAVTLMMCRVSASQWTIAIAGSRDRTLDALRQACIDPGSGAHIGEEPPSHAMPSQVILQVEIENATWAATPIIALNHGLVAIVGARGSGKTALADVIAAGCDATTEAGWNADEDISPSFLVRAQTLIGNAQVTLTWGGGSSITRALDGSDSNGPLAYRRARYLSHQFVEELCSSKGASDGLIREIERVIFEAHTEEQREGSVTSPNCLNRRPCAFASRASARPRRLRRSPSGSRKSWRRRDWLPH